MGTGVTGRSRITLGTKAEISILVFMFDTELILKLATDFIARSGEHSQIPEMETFCLFRLSCSD